MNPRLKIGLTLVLGLLLFCPSAAQKVYFQQEADYDIRVTLDDVWHQLHGEWELIYTNHSPDTLHSIFIHLWPNAYSSRSTAFARQQLRQHQHEFYFAHESHLGRIDSLAFRYDSEARSLQLNDLPVRETADPDVVEIPLDHPLLPDTRITLRTSFSVQLPESFSRLGHVGQSYQVTQWYPKVAVYDSDGWHLLPYLDNGEFYSDFGTYNVRITLPDNYLVAATGVLQTAEEVERLRRQAVSDGQRQYHRDSSVVWEEPPFPRSSLETKTLYFRADQVHDFAWFADKRFRVCTDTLQLPSGRVIDTWAFFTDEDGQHWQSALSYIKAATRYYSDRVGEYPYPQVTAVQSTGSAGGGMEYPMITLIGEVYSGYDLDEVITHEVGHNWFYSVLANNERDHAWMDEGLNSLFERAYLSERYDYPYELPGWLQGRAQMDLNELTYRSRAIRHLDQVPNTTSEALWEPNYWLAAYDKPAAAFRQLEAWVGRETPDHAFQTFFDRWQFRHPQPTDLQVLLEEQTGRELSWLFDGFLNSTAHQDYALHKVRTLEDSLLVSLVNKGGVQSPFPLVVLKDGHPVYERWIEGFDGMKEVTIRKLEYDRIQLDPDHLTLEVNRRNDQWHRSLVPRLEPPEFRLLTGVPADERETIFLSPVPAYNQYDGFFLGLGITNRGLLPRSTEWLLLPAYGFRSRQLIGGFGLRQRWWSYDQWWREIRAGISYRRASFGEFEPLEKPPNYYRFTPSVQVVLQDEPIRERTRRFRLRAVNRRVQLLDFSNAGDLLRTINRKDWLYELSYREKQQDALSPYEFQVALEQLKFRDAFDRPQDHVKLRADARGQVFYRENKAIQWRLFAGVFLHNSLRSSTFRARTALSLFDRGADDYRMDNFYFGRTEQNGLWSQQLAIRNGGFRAPVSSSYPVGYSNDWLFAVNLSIDVPITPPWLPLRPYFDAGYFNPIPADEKPMYTWTWGLALEWLDGRIGIYLPMNGSDNVLDPVLEGDRVIQYFGFRLLLNELAPWQWMDGILD